MIKEKRIKHFLMRLARSVNQNLFEKSRFYLMRGWWPNIQNPESINEWLLWKKMSNQYTSPHLSGTVEAYTHVKTVGFINIPEVCLTIHSETDVLNVSNLQDWFYVLKASHASGLIKFFSIKNGHSDVSVKKLKLISKRWLSYDYSKTSGETCYRQASKCLIVEKSVTQSSQYATDIKIHCYGGKAKIMQVIDRSVGDMQRISYVIDSTESIKKTALYKNEILVDEKLNKQRLWESIDKATELSRPFDYVRIDFLYTKDKIYFGEFTLLPAGACMPLLNRATDELFLRICKA